MKVANPFVLNNNKEEEGSGPTFCNPLAKIARPRAEFKCHAPGLVWLPHCLSGLVDSLIAGTIGGAE